MLKGTKRQQCLEEIRGIKLEICKLCLSLQRKGENKFMFFSC